MQDLEEKLRAYFEGYKMFWSAFYWVFHLYATFSGDYWFSFVALWVLLIKNEIVVYFYFFGKDDSE